MRSPRDKIDGEERKSQGQSRREIKFIPGEGLKRSWISIIYAKKESQENKLLSRRTRQGHVYMGR